MQAAELSASITALANTIAQERKIDEVTLLAAIFVQLGDTLATIAACRAAKDTK